MLIGGAIVVATLLVPDTLPAFVAFPAVDTAYMEAQDLARISHVEQIGAIVAEYANATGSPPLADVALELDGAVMVLIGRSATDEAEFAYVPALRKTPHFRSSAELEQILSDGLGRDIALPRDPEPVATFAPNVYVYFVFEETFCIAAHLSSPSNVSEPYEWEGGTFHSHALCYGR